MKSELIPDALVGLGVLIVAISLFCLHPSYGGLWIGAVSMGTGIQLARLQKRNRR